MLPLFRQSFFPLALYHCAAKFVCLFVFPFLVIWSSFVVHLFAHADVFANGHTAMDGDIVGQSYCSLYIKTLGVAIFKQPLSVKPLQHKYWNLQIKQNTWHIRSKCTWGFGQLWFCTASVVFIFRWMEHEESFSKELLLTIWHKGSFLYCGLFGTWQ